MSPDTWTVHARRALLERVRRGTTTAADAELLHLLLPVPGPIEDMPAPDSRLRQVLDILRDMGSGTSAQVAAASKIAGATGGAVSVRQASQALYTLFLRGLARKVRARDAGAAGCTHIYLYGGPITPAEGERLRDLADPYLAHVE